MRHADITITAGRTGSYGVDPVRYGDFPGGGLSSPRLPRVIRRWLDRRRQRRDLKLLDDRLLQDVGISRIDAAQEFGKPFWRS